MYALIENGVATSDDLEDAHVQLHLGEEIAQAVDLLQDVQLFLQGISFLQGDFGEVDEHFFDGDVLLAA